VLGARREGDGAIFSLYATAAERCAVRVAGVDHPMQPLGGGVFQAEVRSVELDADYLFVLDDRELPDPYARFLPHGVHGPAAIVRPSHRWRSRGVTRPLREQIIYELHIGTFTPRGTYLGAVARLPELVQLGVTTIELMPLSSFAGSRGWGYDGVAHFAPFAPYGSPDELREFIDTAHELGLSVLLDVVYNHFGPAGNYLRAYSSDYFTSAISTPWGDAPDYAKPVMRRFVLDNARYWLEDFRFDGLRLDAIHTIVDRSERHILRELADQVAEMDEPKLLIAESDSNDPKTITELGCHAVWADDFHHQLRVTLTGERDGYYAAFEPGTRGIVDVLEHGWVRGETPAPELSAERFVYCIQNHDQIGNRALGNRLSDDISLDAYAAVSALLLCLPMTPLLFMGQEWAASSPFLYFTDHEPELGELVRRGRRKEFEHFAAFTAPESRERIPDPQAPSTFEASRLRWAERTAPSHQRILDLYRALLSLRRTDPVFRKAGRDDLHAEAHADVLVVRIGLGTEARLVLANFGKSGVPLSELGISKSEWRTLLATTDCREELAPESTLLLAKLSA
jgi:maltooligosyltrehalose trehalohydrolase